MQTRPRLPAQLLFVARGDAGYHLNGRPTMAAPETGPGAYQSVYTLLPPGRPVLMPPKCRPSNLRLNGAFIAVAMLRTSHVIIAQVVKSVLEA